MNGHPRHPSRARAAMTITAIILACSQAGAQQPQVGIVGIGATSCPEFLSQARETAAVQKEYLAWAQGFMSAILLTRPMGIDEQLDLLPPTLPLLEQLRFLHERCTNFPDNSFSEAVEALYKRLREVSGTKP